MRVLNHRTAPDCPVAWGTRMSMTDAHDKAVIVAHSDEVCRLPVKGYGTTEFDMSQQRLDALVEAGRQSMRTYFEANP